MDVNNEYGTLEIQQALLVLLKEFNSFCQKSKIKYSLDSGTLLGAVRHNGFIPWDDDLDVIVDRENYNKLINAIYTSETLVIERLTQGSLWISRIRCKTTNYQGKYSPTLDVFILDHIPNCRLVAFIKKYTIFMLQGMLKCSLSLKKGSFLMKICSFVTYMMGKPFSPKVKYNWYNKVSQWGNKRSCEFGTCYNYIFSEVGTPYHANMLECLILKDFEDMQVPITADYDFTLRQLYGEYMTPPKEDLRKAAHIR